MSHVIDRIFAEVCLDERVSDGIFKLDVDEHMGALRDLFMKKGLTRENATSLTNRMVEGKFPERQAFNKDGILVTFPTPQHKAKAIARGTHFEKNPNPQTPGQKAASEPKIEEPKKNVGPNVTVPKEKDTEDKDDEADAEDAKGKSSGGGKKVQQGDKELDVAPPQGEQPVPPPSAPPVAPQPQTPERIAAQKAVVTQMMATDNTDLGSLDPNPTLNETCKLQLAELFRRGEAMGMVEACNFLKKLVKV